MITAFKAIVIIILVISFIGAIGEKDDKKLQENMAFLCAISMALFFASLVWL
ncbi:YWFCY domain-containing protein [Virgibacillus halodenitrificans]|uniref:YWFCY domain-containing protein n=1 Tax=Virgibacillus halodenitrificans TaxID=1482 RepID=UPI0018CC6D34|nr:YWFCY domain-containing protein [Virgibacillus halodenitrificans]